MELHRKRYNDGKIWRIAQGSATLAPMQFLAVHVAAALTAGTVMLAVASIIVIVLVVQLCIMPKDQTIKLNPNHQE